PGDDLAAAGDDVADRVAVRRGREREGRGIDHLLHVVEERRRLQVPGDALQVVEGKGVADLQVVLALRGDFRRVDELVGEDVGNLDGLGDRPADGGGEGNVVGARGRVHEGDNAGLVEGQELPAVEQVAAGAEVERGALDYHAVGPLEFQQRGA